MSSVTNIMIFLTLGEREPPAFGTWEDFFNAKLLEWSPTFAAQQAFRETTEWYGGSK